MKIIVNALRWVIYIPIIIIAFWLADICMRFMFEQVVNLSTGWIIVLFVTSSMIFVGIIIAIGSTVGMVTHIAPNKKVGGVVFSIIAGIMLISSIYGYWVYFINNGVFVTIIIEILVVIFWVSMIFIPSQTEQIQYEKPCARVNIIHIVDTEIFAGGTTIFNGKQHNVVSINNGIAELEEITEDGLGKSFDVIVKIRIQNKDIIL